MDLKEPKKAYLELADQPANNIPYTYVCILLPCKVIIRPNCTN